MLLIAMGLFAFGCLMVLCFGRLVREIRRGFRG